MNAPLRVLPMLLCMAGIFYLSHQPGDLFPESLFSGEDKVAHMIVYGVLAATIILAFPSSLYTTRIWSVAGISLLVALLYGVSDEFHQSFIPHRDMSIFDLVADGCGAALVCGLWLIYCLRKCGVQIR